MNRDKVFQQLMIDEGVVYEVYNDHLGYPTFGVGPLVTPFDEEYGQPVGTLVSEERVRRVFNQDLDDAICNCRSLYGEGTFDRFPAEVQEILVNMIFNLGPTGLKRFKKMNTHLYNKNWKLAAVEGRDSRWYNQVTNRAERLMTRLENISHRHY